MAMCPNFSPSVITDLEEIMKKREPLMQERAKMAGFTRDQKQSVFCIFFFFFLDSGAQNDGLNREISL